MMKLLPRGIILKSPASPPLSLLHWTFDCFGILRSAAENRLILLRWYSGDDPQSCSRFFRHKKHNTSFCIPEGSAFLRTSQDASYIRQRLLQTIWTVWLWFDRASEGTPLTALLCNLSNIAPEAPDPAQRGSWVPDFQKRGGAEDTQHNSPAFEIMNTNGHKPSSLDSCVRSLFVLLSEAWWNTLFPTTASST